MSERMLGSAYVLESVIGRGAMGQVWRGHGKEGPALAFKVLRSDLVDDPEVVSRFVQERAALLSVNHPNVVRVRDLVVEGGTLAIVMDLVEGPNLRTVLNDRRSLPPAEVARLGAETAEGLAAVHAKGVVHRDIKPENVLLAPSGRALITDFGVAKILDAPGSAGRSTVLVGTPQYIAPELTGGGHPTPAADLYALGILLYELSCGVTPFAGGSTLAVLRRHTDVPPGRPEGIPDDLWDLIAWLLDKRPAGRPQSALQVAGLLAGLSKTLDGVPAAPALAQPPAALAAVVEDDPATVLRGTDAAPAAPAPAAAAAGAAPSQSAPRRRRRGKVIALAAVAVLVLGGGAAAVVAVNGNREAASASGEVAATSSPSPTRTPRTTPTPSATPTPSPTRLSVAPDVVGRQLRELDSLLPGVEVTSVDQLDDQKPDGTVLAQSPESGQPLQRAIEVTVARRAVVNYLADLPTVAGGVSDTGPAPMAGTPYPHAVTFSAPCLGEERFAEWNLGRLHRRLLFEAGWDDNSRKTNNVALVQVIVDGRPVAEQNVAFGTAVPFDIDVTNGLRLIIRSTVVEGAQCYNSGSSHVVLGDPRLLGVPGEAPLPTPRV